MMSRAGVEQSVPPPQTRVDTIENEELTNPQLRTSRIDRSRLTKLKIRPKNSVMDSFSFNVTHFVALLWFNFHSQMRSRMKTWGAMAIALVLIVIATVPSTLSEDDSFDQFPMDQYERLPLMISCPGDSEGDDIHQMQQRQLIQCRDTEGDILVEVQTGFSKVSAQPEPGTLNQWDDLQFKACLCNESTHNMSVLNRFAQYSEQRKFSPIVSLLASSSSQAMLVAYVVALAELFELRSSGADRLLRSNGVTILEESSAWIVLQGPKVVYYSLIALFPLYICGGIVSNWFLIFFVQFCMMWYNIMFAAACSLFVDGTLTLLFFILQYFLVSIIFAMEPVYEPDGLGTFFMVHPAIMAFNFAKLVKRAEGTHTPFSLSRDYYHFRWSAYNGTVEECLIICLVASVICFFIININWGWISDRTKRLVRRMKKPQIGPDSCSRLPPVVREQTSASPDDEVMKVSRVNMVYPGGVHAVRDVSFSVHKGEMVGLLGQNGAGKSSIMNIVSGFLTQTSGRVTIAGVDTRTCPNQCRKLLAYCPQENIFFKDLSVKQNLKFICWIRGEDFSEDAARGILADLNMAEKLSSNPASLSGGQKRRFCIALAYIANCPVVMLDEPTAGVDAATRKILWRFFQRQQKADPERAVILCTHYMEEADILSQRIVIMADGCLRAVGSNHFLKQAYGKGVTISVQEEDDSQAQELISALTPSVTVDKHGAVVNYRLPEDDQDSILKVVRSLDDQNVDYQFQTCTLETVFVAATRPVAVDSSPRPSNHVTSEPFSPLAEGRITSSFIFSLNIDSLMMLRRAWGFFLAFVIAYFAAPFILFNLCDENTDERTVIITPKFLGDDSSILLVSDNPDPRTISDLSRITGEMPVEAISWSDYSRIQNTYGKNGDGAYEFYSKHPFLVEEERSRMYHCGLNPHLAASHWLCMMTLLEMSQPIGRKVRVKYKDVSIYGDLGMEGVYTANEQGKSRVRRRVIRATGDIQSSRTESGGIQGFRWDSERIQGSRRDSEGIQGSRTESEGIHGSRRDSEGMQNSRRDSEVIQGRRMRREGVQGSVKEAVGPGSANYCEALFFSNTLAVIIGFLIFYISMIEIENEQKRLLSYYRANSVLPLASVVVRYITYCVPLFISFLGLAVWTVVADYKLFNSNELIYQNVPSLEVESIFLIVLVSLSNAAFVMFLAKFTQRYFLSLLFAVVAPFFYLQLFQFDYDKKVWEVSFFLGIFFIPAYCIPPCLIGLFFNVARWDEVWIALSINLAVHLATLLLKESLLARQVLYCVRKTVIRDPFWSSEALQVKSLHHSYSASCRCCCKNKREVKALSGLSFSVDPGECYALLGVNGAGKTTTFELITAGIPIQEGSVFIDGVSATYMQTKSLGSMAYCPQYDSIPMYSTAARMALLFGRLRGQSAERSAKHAARLAKLLECEQHMEKPMGKCSGGTKRKFCTMFAFIGYPPVIILDECTTGIDPVARLRIAEEIRIATHEKNSAVIISSHTMEECESIADKICIMTAGKKGCEGSPAELRRTLGNFYHLKITLEKNHSISTEEQAEKLTKKLWTDLKDCEVVNCCSVGEKCYVFVNVQKHDLKFSQLLSILQQKKEEGLFTDFTANTASLEHIFMQIALNEESTI